MNDDSPRLYAFTAFAAKDLGYLDDALSRSNKSRIEALKRTDEFYAAYKWIEKCERERIDTLVETAIHRFSHT
ncbi:MAG TPA: hypothetical protein VJJ82_04080 [Candidatus Nanoarchaeia archaeon]|nr:hypothetical protein [Candidatus Nanoarchaeia archaeon]